jgi:hypothetical protein
MTNTLNAIESRGFVIKYVYPIDDYSKSREVLSIRGERKITHYRKWVIIYKKPSGVGD